jgi:hypothetical protein
MLQLLVITAIACAGCPRPQEDAGGPCENDYQCKGSLFCFDQECSEPFTVGESCAKNDHCESGECAALKCISKEEAEAMRRAEEKRKERKLLEESRVEDTRIESETERAEQVAPPAGPGLPVRVVRTSQRNKAFAACRMDERLIGGGCKAEDAVFDSYPSGHGETDTVGARWNCRSNPYEEYSAVEAYALCQKLPPTKSAND